MSSVSLAGRPAGMQPLVTCLWYDGGARLAAEFYAAVFPDARVLSSSGEGPGGEPMAVEFEIAGARFVGINAGPQFRFTEAVSFQVFCETQEEVDYYWDALLAEGGEESQCGWLKDRFGVSWQVLPRELPGWLTSEDAEARVRVTEAMMPMQKLDLAALRAAVEG